MDQYPYSIPPASYQYPGGPPEKNHPAASAVDEAGRPLPAAPNPYFMNAPAVDPAYVGYGAGAAPQGPPQPPMEQPNGVIPPTGYGDQYPPPQPQHYPAQPMGPVEPIYSQQSYAREANVGSYEGVQTGEVPAAHNQHQAPFEEQQPQKPEEPAPAPAAGAAGSSDVPVDRTDDTATVDQVAPESDQPTRGATLAPEEPPAESTVPTAPIDKADQANLTTEETTPAAAQDAPTETPEATKPADGDAPEAPSSSDPVSQPPAADIISEITPEDPIGGLASTEAGSPSLPVQSIPLIPTSNKKKRRRIVQFNDDDSDDDENAQDRMELLRSPEPPAATGDADENDAGTENQSTAPADDLEKSTTVAADGEANVEKDDDPEKENRDGDGEEESVTATPSIFQNVVMISAGDSEAHKRKKIRVLDSDDEDEEQRVVDNVDDIGLTGEGADDLNPGGFEGENGEDGEFEGMEQIVAMDAPIIDPSEMMDDEEEEEEAGGEEKDKEGAGSDRERDAIGSDAEEQREGEPEEPVEEEEEEEEEAEEGVELITAEDDAGEAIGLATDDEKDLEEEEDDGKQASEADRGSDQESAAQSGAEESEEDENDQSDSRSAAGSQEEEEDDDEDKNSQDASSDQNQKEGGKSDDEVVCQNDLELNTISLLTDEEDNNPMPLPPPKKELPVVRIVNIKKELLDDRHTRKERNDSAASSYQQQHYLKQQQLAQRKKEKQKKKRERTFDNNDPFGAWSSSSTDDEFIPNDIYFGTPDRVFTVSTKMKCQRQKQLNERHSGKYGKYGKRRYSDDSDVEDRRRRKQKLDQVAKLNLPSYQQAQLQNMIKKKKKRRDRFYDKSQDIPNDIYFGNVNVPLHILHSFGDSSSDEDRNRPSTSWKSSSSGTSKSSKYYSSGRPYKTSSSSSSYTKSLLSPSNDRSVQAMKEYLKIAGFKSVKFHKLWEGCKSNKERAEAILRLMQDKGLEGEPTIAKCRELRKQLQMEREAQVLDTSLIIDSGEGRVTRRRARHTENHGSADGSAPSTSGQAVIPEGLQTLNRIQSLVDPDSDGE